MSGADRIDQRPGFKEMLQRLAANGAKTIIVESPNRFARDLAVQLAGHDMLKGLGISIIPASAPDILHGRYAHRRPGAPVLGAIAQFEKASNVAKLAAARPTTRRDTAVAATMLGDDIVDVRIDLDARNSARAFGLE